MLAILLNKKGFSIVEALIAIFITGIAAVSILAMQSTSWRTVSNSDYFGRAAGILQTELELRQHQISRGIDMTSQNTFNQDFWPLGAAHSRNVHVIDPLSNAVNTTITGDKVFTVTTTVTNNPTNNPLLTKQYLINVQVIWPGTVKGIKSSMIVLSP